MAYHGLIEIIQGTQNIAEKYTTVTANCYCVRDSGYAYSGYIPQRPELSSRVPDR